MLTRLVEWLLMTSINSARRPPSRHDPKPALETVDPNDVLVGDMIGNPAANGSGGAVRLSPDERRRHLYLLGATGCGKTNLIMQLVESDIRAGRSLCVVDLRGDLIDRVLIRLAAFRRPEELVGKVLLMDLRDDEQIVGFNPLGGPGLAYGRALHLLSVVRHQADSWGVQLDETLRNALMALGEAGWSMLELDPLLTNPRFRASVMASVTDSYVRSFFTRYDSLTAEKQMAWALPVLNKVTPLLAIPRLRLMFGQRQGFSFPDLIDREPGSIVLVGLGVDRLHGASHLVGSLFVSAFQTAVMERASIPERQRIPVHLYVDEFETMASESFEAIVAEGRRFGLGLCLSHQNAHQIQTSLRHVLRNNVHTQFYFQTGAMDAADLADEIGDGRPKEELRTALMSQRVGETFVIRRGQPSVQVRVRHSPDPRVEPGAVQAIRDAALQAYARPRVVVEQELSERAAMVRRLDVDPDESVQTLEVRDVQVPKAPGRRRSK